MRVHTYFAAVAVCFNALCVEGDNTRFSSISKEEANEICNTLFTQRKSVVLYDKQPFYYDEKSKTYKNCAIRIHNTLFEIGDLDASSIVSETYTGPVYFLYDRNKDASGKNPCRLSKESKNINEKSYLSYQLSYFRNGVLIENMVSPLVLTEKGYYTGPSSKQAPFVPTENKYLYLGMLTCFSDTGYGYYGVGGLLSKINHNGIFAVRNKIGNISTQDILSPNIPENARNWQSITIENEGFTYSSLDNSIQRLNAGLTWGLSIFNDDSVFILLYSGHGGQYLTDTDPIDELDGKDENLSMGGGATLSDDIMRNLLAKINCRVLFFCDTCHAGTMYGGDGIGYGVPDNVLFIGSCKEDELEPIWGNSQVLEEKYIGWQNLCMNFDIAMELHGATSSVCPTYNQMIEKLRYVYSLSNSERRFLSSEIQKAKQIKDDDARKGVMSGIAEKIKQHRISREEDDEEDDEEMTATLVIKYKEDGKWSYQMNKTLGQ